MAARRARLFRWGLLVLVIAGAVLGWVYHRTTRFDHNIRQASARNGLDFHLVKAVVFEESWFDPNIKGPAGEVGLMQITVAAAKDFCDRKGFPVLGEGRLFEPDLNLEVGCWYLRQALDRFRNSPNPELFALLRYNAGEARAVRWLEQALSKPPPLGVDPEEYYLSLVDFPGTREYARHILRRHRGRNFWF
jgi:peptidoglycan lytic transglycosylase